MLSLKSTLCCPEGEQKSVLKDSRKTLILSGRFSHFPLTLPITSSLYHKIGNRKSEFDNVFAPVAQLDRASAYGAEG
jgi:hypothetical protein